MGIYDRGNLPSLEYMEALLEEVIFMQGLVCVTWKHGA